MFESAEVRQRLSPRAFEKEEPRLRARLLDAQYRLLDARTHALLILVAGIDGAGKGESVNMLNAWLDPRHISTRAFGEPTDEDRQLPPFARYWRLLPRRGRLGIFFGSWCTDVLEGRVAGRLDADEVHRRTEEIRRLERMLIEEHVLIVKFWYHLSKADQGERLRKLAAHKRTRWRVTEEDWKNHRRYGRIRDAAEELARETSTPEAPWTVIEGYDANYRHVATARVVLAAFEEATRIGARPPQSRSRGRSRQARKGGASALAEANPVSTALLQKLDLTLRVGKQRYEEELDELQGRLNELTRARAFAQRSLVVVFEGWDAAGKGGTIRRITAALDARQYAVVPTAAPTDEELAHPYLWRFWRRVPARGRVALFDRSWYGRVLVERVEGLCPPSDWMRAYDEINLFEQELAGHGAIVRKFWLHISPAEQLKRFRAREDIAYKRYKITGEDWRNRRKWREYERAVCEMISRTSTATAPWVLIEAEDKRYARLKVLRSLVEALRAATA